MFGRRVGVFGSLQRFTDWLVQVICSKEYKISFRAFEIWDLCVVLRQETRLLGLDLVVKRSIGIFVTRRVGAFGGIILGV